MGTIKLALIGILLAGLLFGFAMPVLADDPPQLTTIEVTPINPSINVDKSLEFTASGKDQNGDPFPLSDPQWEGDTWHGTISVNPTDPNKCTFTATAPGNSYIMCWEGPPRQGPHGSTDITITRGSGQVLGSIVVKPSSVTLEIGQSKQFAAEGFDTNGDLMDPPITPMWSTDGGTITQSGEYTAPSTAGDYTVTACVSGSTITGTANVHVTAPPQQLASISVTPASVNLQAGEQQQFTAIGYDTNGNQMNPPITPIWSTDGGAIDQTGKYTATTEGDFTVTASVEGSTVKGTATVHVTPPGTPVKTATGSGTAYFANDAGTLENLAAVDGATLPAEGKPALVFPHGFFSFNITGLTPCTHQKVVVTITLPSAVPVGTEYWKYHASEGGWIRIPMGSDDGDAVITITLEDGGLGDDDGECNGVIVDSGGPGVPAVIFDTGSPANPYPSIYGTHNGTITPNVTITL